MAEPCPTCGRPKPRRRRDLSGHGDGRDSVYVKVHPAIYWGQPCIVWRINPEQMADYHWSGWGFEEIQADFQSVTRAHVLVACWYLGEYSRSRTYRQRYGVWARYAHSWLWHSDYDGCPDPPANAQPLDEAALQAAHDAYLAEKARVVEGEG